MMQQNFELFRSVRSYYFHSSFFRQYDPECDWGIDKTLGSISAVPRSLGGSFSSTAAYNWA